MDREAWRAAVYGVAKSLYDGMTKHKGPDDTAQAGQWEMGEVRKLHYSSFLPSMDCTEGQLLLINQSSGDIPNS